MISSMRSFASSKAAFLAAVLIVAQNSLPAQAGESTWQDGSAGQLGQSDWIAAAGSGGQSPAALGQSDWMGGQGEVAGGQSLGHSGWVNAQSSPAQQGGNTLGQSGWNTPKHNTSGLASEGTGQSGWMQQSGTSGQSDWMQQSGSGGQSGWTQAGGLGGQSGFSQAGQSFSGVSNNATVVPRAMSQGMSPQLKGAVSTGNSFGGADLSPLGDGDMSFNTNSAPAGFKDIGGNTTSSSTPAGFKDIGDAADPAAGGLGMMGMGMGMGGAGMDEMIGNVMMIPMMMAASSGMLGGKFRTYGPGGGGGGFRTYGPGGGVGGGALRRVSSSNPSAFLARRAALRAIRGGGR